MDLKKILLYATIFVMIYIVCCICYAMIKKEPIEIQSLKVAMKLPSIEQKKKEVIDDEKEKNKNKEKDKAPVNGGGGGGGGGTSTKTDDNNATSGVVTTTPADTPAKTTDLNSNNNTTTTTPKLKNIMNLFNSKKPKGSKHLELMTKSTDAAAANSTINVEKFDYESEEYEEDDYNKEYNGEEPVLVGSSKPIVFPKLDLTNVKVKDRKERNKLNLSEKTNYIKLDEPTDYIKFHIYSENLEDLMIIMYDEFHSEIYRIERFGYSSWAIINGTNQYNKLMNPTKKSIISVEKKPSGEVLINKQSMNEIARGNVEYIYIKAKKNISVCFS